MTIPRIDDITTYVIGHPWLQAALIVILGLLAARLVATAVHRRVARGANSHLALVARTILWYGGVIVVMLYAARAIGLEITALLATAGVATIAVGFAAQTSLGNLIAGLFLLVDRPFKVGDTVELEGRLGAVQEITLLSTLLRTFDGILVRWPNEVVLKATILNMSRYPARRMQIPVGVAYDTDLDHAHQVLLAAVTALPQALVEPPPQVNTVRFGTSSVDLEVWFWIEPATFLQSRTAGAHAIHKALREAGITIPFPQVTVWTGSSADEPPASNASP